MSRNRTSSGSGARQPAARSSRAARRRASGDWYDGPARERSEWERVLRMIPGYDSITTAAACGADRYVFDAGEAALRCDFFAECLRHNKGALAGQPFVLEAWERALISNLFGWRERASGARRYRKCLLFVPRKNGKSSLAAGIILSVMVMDNEPGAEIIGGAGSAEQATFIFDHVVGFIRQEPRLAERLQVYKTAVTYETPPHLASYKRVSSDGGLQHGANVHLGVVDELHVQRSDELVEALESGIGGRRQPLLLYVTTAGVEREQVCREKYDYFRGVRDGTIDDPAALPVIYEAPPDADWTSEQTWRAANPNIGVSVSVEFLREQCAEARSIARKENSFRRLHLNQWVEQHTRWIAMEHWDACDGDVHWTELRDELRGRVAYGGVDLASTSDTTAVTLVFPPAEASAAQGAADDSGGGIWHVLRWTWVPERTVHERALRHTAADAPYHQWARSGSITVTPGAVTDYSRVRAAIVELASTYEVCEWGYDPWNATHLVHTQLGEEDGLRVVAVRQGPRSLSEPCKLLERLVLGRRLIHGGDPVLRWSMEHCAVRADENENIAPDKKRSTDRIDAIVACVIALSRAMVQPGPARSIYETRDEGLIVL